MSSPESLREIKQIIIIIAILVGLGAVLFFAYSMATIQPRTDPDASRAEPTTQLTDGQVMVETTQQESECRCDGDVNRYDCTDFEDHDEAQACYEKCIDEIDEDIHFLDNNNDGIACEGLLEN